MKAGDLFIDAGSEKPVVLLGEDLMQVEYANVVAHVVRILDTTGKVRTLDVKMLRSIR